MKLYDQLVYTCGTVAKAADLLGMKPSAIYQWRHRGIPDRHLFAVRQTIKARREKIAEGGRA